MKLTTTITPQSISVSIQPARVDVGFSAPIVRDYLDRDPYEGDYEITPTDETQVLQTAGKWDRENITIKPIPSNYGRITWDGRTITVS